VIRQNLFPYTVNDITSTAFSKNFAITCVIQYATKNAIFNIGKFFCNDGGLFIIYHCNDCLKMY
jgi:hypothetical protein